MFRDVLFNFVQESVLREHRLLLYQEVNSNRVKYFLE